MSSTLISLATIAVLMLLLSVVEAAAPRNPPGAWHRAHRAPNLGLTAVNLVLNGILNVLLVLALTWLADADYRPLRWLGSPTGVASLVAVIVVLDLAVFAAHLTMHRVPWLWRLHRVHHSDPAIDVTTTIRQHPGEGLVRYVFISATALALGAGPWAYAIYRAWSVAHALAAHSNVRLPARLDAWLGVLVITPTLHEVHHARDVTRIANYGNVLSVFDRLFGTLVRPGPGEAVVPGIPGSDVPERQQLRALLRMPFSTGTIAAALALALLAASACVPHIHSQWTDPVRGRDAAACTTYAWIEPDDVVGQRARRGVDQRLADLGLARTAVGGAQVLGAIAIDRVHRFRLEGGPDGSAFVTSGPGSRQTRWTIKLHWIDADAGHVLWRARRSAWSADLASIEAWVDEAAITLAEVWVADLRAATRRSPNRDGTASAAARGCAPARRLDAAG